jgi:hypothetical protein
VGFPLFTQHDDTMNSVKNRARALAYDLYSTGAMIPRRLTSSRRHLPDFLIIGAQKCGTASLFAYLTSHPSILRSFRKEIHYFDRNFHRGEAWYRAFFPMSQPGAGEKADAICGEASPYYLFHPHAPQRAAATVPHAKLIVLLRDPVRRAFSQYLHRVRRQHESRTFEAVIEDEIERFPAEHARLLEDPHHQSVFHQHECYLARGRYIEQLQNWSRWFPRESMMIIRSESMFDDPARVFSDLLGFLGVSDDHTPEFAVHNRDGSGARMNVETGAWLRNYFEPYNRALYDWLGVDFGW